MRFSLQEIIDMVNDQKTTLKFPDGDEDDWVRAEEIIRYAQDLAEHNYGYEELKIKSAIRKLRDALEGTIMLKMYKDKYGENKVYQKRRPEIFDTARRALEDTKEYAHRTSIGDEYPYHQRQL